jgi:hypothetical protein
MEDLQTRKLERGALERKGVTKNLGKTLYN